MTDHSRAGERNLVDEPGVAHALHVIIVAILGSSLAVSVFTFFLGWPLVPRVSLVAAASGLAALMLSRYGWIRPGVLLALAGIAYCVLHVAAKNDGVQNIGLATVPVLIVVCSLLLDFLTLALFTVGTILATIGMLAIRYYVLRLEQYSTNDLGDFFIFAVTCATAALVGRLLAVQIQEGFRLVRASERRYRRMFENIQDVYYEMRSDGTLLELSPAGAALFGIPREEMIGRSLAEFCVNRPEFDDLVAALLQHGRVSNRELVIRNSGATPVHVLVNALLQNGVETGEERMIGSIRDITERRRAEEALRESEARLRLALEATGAGTFDFFPQTGRLIWCDIAKGHFGMSADTEVDHDRFLSAVHPDDLDRVREAETLVAIPGSGGQLAIEYRTAGVEDGRERWIAVQGRMLFDEENRATRLIGTTLDISDRKRLEEELRRRVEELQKIMDVAPVALFTAHDPECRAVTVNRMGNAMLEVAEGANSPSAPGGPIPPCPFFRNGVEVPVDELPLQTAARGVEVRDSELEALLPSGRRRLLWGHATSLRDAAGRVRGAVAAIQDVTEARQRTDALLRESEDRFRNTADAAPVIIWFGDTEKRLTFVNEQFIRFTGLPSEQLLGNGWAQVIHPDDLDAARAVYYKGVDSRASYQLEYRARRADGEYRHMLGTTRPRYVGREYAGQVGSVIDITDLKRRQEGDIARQKLESVGMLASGIAHDFNNLLGSVLGQAELALSELAAGGRPQEELRRIGEVATRGSEIVRQLMIYAGKESEPSGIVDVSRTVKDMLELLSVLVSKRATLRTDLGMDLRPVRADATQIRQIVMNLVTNASEAISDQDGVIHLTTQCVTVGPNEFGADGRGLAEGEYVQIQVSDTGCGMSMETQAKLFDPFFSTKSAGRGLGLAVVQGIVRRLDGAIDVASEPGSGATFRVLLPLSEMTAPAMHDPISRADQASGPSGAATILIVEDEQWMRESVAKMLRKRGFSIIEAGDGWSALEAIRAQKTPVDVLLLDITLPGPSSRVVLEEAKRLMPQTKVIATSAYSEDVASRSLEGELEFFIRKPYRLGDLVDLVRQAVARR